MSKRSKSPVPPTVHVSESARRLQERLHELLSRLAATIDKVKSWPEASGDDASIHVEKTSQLIANIRTVLDRLKKVEDTVKDDAALRASLQQCCIPLDLLDLLDSSHLHPDCFSRGLLREAMGQMAGLKRRKLALELLGVAVQSGINQKRAAAAAAVAVKEEEQRPVAVAGVKRDREEDVSGDSEPPPAKKQAVEKTDLV